MFWTRFRRRKSTVVERVEAYLRAGWSGETVSDRGWSEMCAHAERALARPHPLYDDTFKRNGA